ncbi:toll/interleukin-1 receptor domain-containing protein [Tahibacter sp. UC22_41]|uniref:toll/interleukin-1 receptor domain-containing protein n=1 Tax=Tahibacter sp. UC22_41 TaxID=3350178 RepID=UPI0036DD1568
MTKLWTPIRNLIAPSYFISYSSKQMAFAQALRSRLGDSANRLWFDCDSLFVGDDWLNEIKRGITRSDELVLLLSNESLGSRIVMEEEVAAALALKKSIRPFIVKEISSDKELPGFISNLQVRDLSAMPEDAAVKAICDHLNTQEPDIDKKLKFCRGIYPSFNESYLAVGGQADLAATCALLESILPNYDKSSLVWLNAGLSNCLAGNWTKGVEYLREHARQANSFVGWYFYSLHSWQRRLILRSRPEEVRDADVAVRLAISLQQHPFASLIAAIVECGGLNLGIHRAEYWLRQFFEGFGEAEESHSESKRLFWCLQPSLRVLGRNESLVSNFLRSISRER